MAEKARRLPDEAEQARSTKYQNTPLFDYTGPAVRHCLARLRRQPILYRSYPHELKRMMLVRGLFFAAFTLNATAIWTAKLLHRGTFSMITQKRFFYKRWRLDPEEWGMNAKSCFARALAGYSIGKDGVCVDRHLERLNLQPTNAVKQWADWFRLYESMYGPGETILCVRWHVESLDWIAGLRGRPEPWK